MEPILKQRLQPLIWRTRLRRTVVALSLVWVLAAVLAISLYWSSQNGIVFAKFWPSTLFWGTALATVVAVLLAWAWPVPPLEVVKSIEESYPELDSTLLTAVEQTSTAADGRLGFLQMDVLRRAVAHSYENHWPGVVPGWQLLTVPMAGLLGLAAFFAATLALVLYPGIPSGESAVQFEQAAIDSKQMVIQVDPGNCETERGSSILVMARFPEAVPADCTLVFSRGESQTARVMMNKSLDDPMFGGRIEGIDQPLSYHIEYGPSQNDRSETYQVNVFEYPELVRADATLEYPDYTKQPTKTIQDVRRLTAVEGTLVQLELYLNKPVAELALVPTRKVAGALPEPLTVVADSIDRRAYRVDLTLDQTQRYRLELKDENGRGNRVPPVLAFNVVRNRAPELTVVLPGRDSEASSLEEVQLAAEGKDDFGVTQFGLSYSTVGAKPTEIRLGAKSQREGTPSATRSNRLRAEHLLTLESLDVQPDDLLAYYFWAEDIGPDGNPRRVLSEMYFIEVRRFDEIFRQGEAQPDQPSEQKQQSQQQSPSAQQAEQLAALQKQIMTGTWNIHRRESISGGLAPAKEQPFSRDVETLAKSQALALVQVDELAQKLQDPTAKSLISPVREAMAASIASLEEALERQELAPLEEALASQQASYQGLLRMRARETEVSMQQQQSSQSQSSSQSQRQQQLNQLNVDRDRNRYEQEKMAQREQESAQEAAADREVLDRLKELARRQEDLNERIKELVTALEEATTDAEQEEIERRLKSLREQQEKMLRDTDELLENMNQEQNRDRMGEESEQLAETREGMREANEALQDRELAQAAAAGTRAQRELENLRDEFKKRAAGEFTQRMRQMRNQAQDIEKQQQEIADQLQGEKSAKLPETGGQTERQARSLRDERDQPELDLEQALADQSEAVEDLRRQMRETIEEAESVEPLLAESLYQTYRDSEVSRPDRALETTRRSLARGWTDDALQQQEQAQQGIRQLRQGIEKAAEQVLGDETEALKAAAEALEELKQGIDNELAQSSSEQERSGDSKSSKGDGESQPAAQDSNGRPGNPESKSSDPAEADAADSSERRGDTKNSGQPEADSQQTKSPPSEQAGSKTSANQPDSQQSDNKDSPQRPSGQSRDQPGGQAELSGDSDQGEPADIKESRSAEQESEAVRQAQNELMQKLGGGEPANQNQTSENRGQQDVGNSRTLNAGNQTMRPIAGKDFRQWNDQLRDVEEMLDDPDLRAEASRIRQQAREIRKDLKERHSAEPNWDLVKLQVAKPLAELQREVTNEILRRTAKDARVPINREPVPVQYEDAVRDYYRRLGVGK